MMKIELQGIVNSAFYLEHDIIEICCCSIVKDIKLLPLFSCIKQSTDYVITWKPAELLSPLMKLYFNEGTCIWSTWKSKKLWLTFLKRFFSIKEHVFGALLLGNVN